MKKTTLLVLALFVAGLWWMTRRQVEESTRSTAFQLPLAEDFDPDSVLAMRIDHLGRATQVTLERDSEGSWFLTAPLAYPAKGEVMRQLLRQLYVAQGIRIDRDLGELGLEPPQIVLELDQADPVSGARRTLRFEFGGFDVDPTRMYIRVAEHSQATGGVVLRGPRSLFSYLDYSVNDLRETRLADLSGNNISSLRRRGKVDLPELGGELDLDLDALLDHGGWRRVDSPRMGLDPGVMGTIARAAAELRARGFAADGFEFLGRFGLDPPEFEVMVADEMGQEVTLLLGRTSPEDDQWHCARKGSGAIAYISERDVHLLAQPAHNLYDYRVFRGLRDDIERVDLTAGGRTLVLQRDDDDWWVSVAGAAERFGADHGEVQDLITRLERAELAAFLEVPFEPGDEPRAWRVRTRGGQEWGGRIGARARDPVSGAEGWQFLRADDELIAILGEVLVRSVELSLDELRRKLLYEVAESAIDRIQFRMGERTLAFQRGGENGDRWFPAGIKTPLPVDSPFFEILEQLKRPRAEVWLASDGDLGRDPVEITLRGSFVAKERSFTVALGPNGASRLRQSGGQLAALDPGVHPDLHAKLVELFRP